jgi:hypothetical protein
MSMVSANVTQFKYCDLVLRLWMTSNLLEYLDDIQSICRLQMTSTLVFCYDFVYL